MAKKANNPFARTLISNANMDPAQKFRIEEAYKSIRTNIMLSILKKGCKTIVVSSGSPAEAKRRPPSTWPSPLPRQTSGCC